MNDFPSIWFPVALPEGVRDMSWHSISLELQMKPVHTCLEIKEYIEGWIHLNMVKEKLWKLRSSAFKMVKEQEKLCVNLVTNVNLILLSKWLLIATFSPAASAFSERYLGLPKPDPRAYTVRYDWTFLFMFVIISVLIRAHLFLSVLYSDG